MERVIIDGINQRLDAHGCELETVGKCLERLTVLTERMDSTESDHEQRLRALEGHSGALWEKVVQTGISAVVGGFLAFALMQIGL